MKTWRKGSDCLRNKIQRMMIGWGMQAAVKAPQLFAKGNCIITEKELSMRETCKSNVVVFNFTGIKNQKCQKWKNDNNKSNNSII